ncbi:SdpI family protein [Idiomarina sp.]|uniref:SdpI family protein n=1 Tax=Idiomarina sp. TaxID=1874361 RepID=UPI0025BACA2F|nr:SdpI family protein [Idiomarina sp.]NQZ03914.1 SdpI family protein [Idiomarina sp.]
MILTLSSKHRWISWLFIVLSAVFVAAIYKQLPQEIPSHWNFAGEVDDYQSKPLGAWLMTLLMIALWALMECLHVLSPKGYSIDSFRTTIGLITNLMLGFLLLIQVAQLSVALGAELELPTIIMVGVGVLFICLGNYLGKLRKNFFIGIRTPWTLASDEVWYKTHRVGSYCFVIIGAVLVSRAWWTIPQSLFIALIVALALVPTVYSFVIYRRLHRNDSED